MATLVLIAFLLVIVAVTFLAVQSVVLRARTVAAAEVAEARQRFPDVLDLFREASDYEVVDPSIGQTIMRLRLDTDLTERRTEIMTGQTERARLVDAPERMLRTAETALLGTEASLSIMRNALSRFERDVANANASIDLAIAAGLLDENGSAPRGKKETAGSDLAATVRRMREAVTSDVVRRQPDLLADLATQVDALRGEVADLKKRTPE